MLVVGGNVREAEFRPLYGLISLMVSTPFALVGFFVLLLDGTGLWAFLGMIGTGVIACAGLYVWAFALLFAVGWSRFQRRQHDG
ncbi:hypothetical protein [Streptacidiphilus carbonis]|uniref:hypothetical protein n=1 Tax=Streptacidiphilus carbonis TaxID=105422 RepID=UPI00126A26F0|nr:hypothetical protein [Streptacidiphilus carbonis]